MEMVWFWAGICTGGCMLGSFLPADADLCLCNTAVLCGQRLVVGGGDGQAWNPHFGCALSMCRYGLCMSGVVSKAKYRCHPVYTY